MMLHRFSKFLVACTVLLILAGSLVTSHDAGLSVPDWPTSYGWNMFTFPPSMWVANILYEHGHRLIASTVGFLTIIMAVWLWMADSRRWLRWFGVAALGSVIAQGVLGGLTVLFFLPAAVSTAHAGLAEIFFCMTVAIAIFTSPGWIAGYGAGADTVGGSGRPEGRPLRGLATLATILIYAQILVGATMRHTGAGLAIPDFPWMFGHVVPDHWSSAIAIHFTHRVGALIVTLAILTVFAYVWSHHRERRELLRPAIHPGDVKIATATVMQKKISARPACAVETAAGRKKSTVTPPSTPCATTDPSAATPNQPSQRRGSAIQSQTAMTIVSNPTVLAMSRWPCS